MYLCSCMAGADAYEIRLGCRVFSWWEMEWGGLRGRGFRGCWWVAKGSQLITEPGILRAEFGSMWRIF
jgi:hypothetical protein